MRWPFGIGVRRKPSPQPPGDAPREGRRLPVVSARGWEQVAPLRPVTAALPPLVGAHLLTTPPVSGGRPLVSPAPTSAPAVPAAAPPSLPSAGPMPSVGPVPSAVDAPVHESDVITSEVGSPPRRLLPNLAAEPRPRPALTTAAGLFEQSAPVVPEAVPPQVEPAFPEPVFPEPATGAPAVEVPATGPPDAASEPVVSSVAEDLRRTRRAPGRTALISEPTVGLADGSAGTDRPGGDAPEPDRGAEPSATQLGAAEGAASQSAEPGGQPAVRVSPDAGAPGSPAGAPGGQGRPLGLGPPVRSGSASTPTAGPQRHPDGGGPAPGPAGMSDAAGGDEVVSSEVDGPPPRLAAPTVRPAGPPGWASTEPADGGGSPSPAIRPPQPSTAAGSQPSPAGSAEAESPAGVAGWAPATGDPASTADAGHPPGGTHGAAGTPGADEPAERPQGAGAAHGGDGGPASGHQAAFTSEAAAPERRPLAGAEAAGPTTSGPTGGSGAAGGMGAAGGVAGSAAGGDGTTGGSAGAGDAPRETVRPAALRRGAGAEALRRRAAASATPVPPAERSRPAGMRQVAPEEMLTSLMAAMAAPPPGRPAAPPAGEPAQPAQPLQPPQQAQPALPPQPLQDIPDGEDELRASEVDEAPARDLDGDHADLDGEPPRLAPVTFRATLPVALSAPVAPPQSAGVPPAAVSSFQRLTGIDLGFVPMLRGPRVARAAAELGARAYTSGGTVHLPADAGPADRADTHALLAHELTHVAQQRALGSVASEVGGHGGELEAIAQAVERAARGESVDLPGLSGANGLLGGLGGGGGGGGGLSWTPADGFVSEVPPPARDDGPREEYAPPQRAPLATAPDDVYSSTDEPPPATPPVEPPEPSGYQETAMSPEELTAAIARIDGQIGSLPAGTQPSQATRALSADSVARIVARQLSGQYISMDDPHDLDTLAGRIYERLRNQLRMELLVDHERGGMLTEFR